MSRRDAYRAELGPLLASPLDPGSLEAYLRSRSGLPGPRGNLELAAAFADVAGPIDDGALRRLLRAWVSIPAEVAPTGDPGEFLVFCALQALGDAYPRGDDSARREVAAVLRDAADDPRWRVREGSATAMQRIGEADVPALLALVREWRPDATLTGLRALVAALAHPPILGDRRVADLALDLGREVVLQIPAMDAATRRTEAFRVLSTGLEYALSVFVAAAPEAGFPVLRQLASIDDRDVRRIVRANLGKKRLAGHHAGAVEALRPLIGG